MAGFLYVGMVGVARGDAPKDLFLGADNFGTRALFGFRGGHMFADIIGDSRFVTQLTGDAAVSFRQDVIALTASKEGQQAARRNELLLREKALAAAAERHGGRETPADLPADDGPPPPPVETIPVLAAPAKK